MKYNKLYNLLIEKQLSDVKIHKGKMHRALGIPQDKEITDVYTSGEKLAKDLVNKIGLKKAKGMLAYAANINPDENVFDVALRNLPVKEDSTRLEIKSSDGTSGYYSEEDDQVDEEVTAVQTIKDKIGDLKQKIRDLGPSTDPKQKGIWTKTLQMLTQELGLATKKDQIEKEQERLNKQKGKDTTDDTSDTDESEV